MITYFDNLVQTVRDAVLSLDEEKFNQLADESVAALTSGKKIIVSGLGKNVPVCDKFVGTMNSMGQDASYMNTNSAAHGDLGMVHEGDLVILLTKSGETEESIYLARLLQQRACNLWLVTFKEHSALTEMIGKCLILHLDHEGDPWNMVPNNSTTVNLIILQGLAMEVVKRRGVTLGQFKKNHPGGSIGEQLKHV